MLFRRVLILLVTVSIIQEVRWMVLWQPSQQLLVVLLNYTYSIHYSNNYRRSRSITGTTSFLAVVLTRVNSRIEATTFRSLFFICLVHIAALVQFETVLLSHIEGFGFFVAAHAIIDQWLLAGS